MSADGHVCATTQIISDNGNTPTQLRGRRADTTSVHYMLVI